MEREFQPLLSRLGTGTGTDQMCLVRLLPRPLEYAATILTASWANAGPAVRDADESPPPLAKVGAGSPQPESCASALRFSERRE